MSHNSCPEQSKSWRCIYYMTNRTSPESNNNNKILYLIIHVLIFGPSLNFKWHSYYCLPILPISCIHLFHNLELQAKCHWSTHCLIFRPLFIHPSSKWKCIHKASQSGSSTFCATVGHILYPQRYNEHDCIQRTVTSSHHHHAPDAFFQL